MDDSDIEDLRELLEKQDLRIRTLDKKVDRLIELATVYQAFFSVHAAEPDFFSSRFSPAELLKLMQDKRKTLAQKIELLSAARKRRASRTSPPSGPAGAQN